jgi:hypothetical protein
MASAELTVVSWRLNGDVATPSTVPAAVAGASAKHCDSDSSGERWCEHSTGVPVSPPTTTKELAPG